MSSISTDKPISLDNKLNMVFSTDITNKYDLIEYFIKKNNKMSTGNTTLLKRVELNNYIDMGATAIVMLKQDKIMGFIMSLYLPIKIDGEVFKVGCTSFMNIHSALRGMGLAKNLMNELMMSAYEKQIYTDYHLGPLTDVNSIQLQSYFYPLDMRKCILAGFSSPTWLTSKPHEIISKYQHKLSKDIRVKRIGNSEEALSFYLKEVSNKRYAFYPDKELWSKWVNTYPTYTVYRKKKMVGIFTLGTVSCETTLGKELTLATPFLCAGKAGLVFPAMISEARRFWDALYFYSTGIITSNIADKFNCIQGVPTNLSFYNNDIVIDKKDIFVPLI